MIGIFKHAGFVQSIKVWTWLISALIIGILGQCWGTEVVRIPVKKTGAGRLFQIHGDDKWGYIDRDGHIIVRPQFDDEGDFFNSLAKVRKGGQWGYIDEVGHVVITYRYDDAGDFSEGLAAVQVGRKWGYIDTSGKLVIEPRFQAAAEFKDGLSRFEIWDTAQCGPNAYAKENAPLYAFRLHDAKSVAIGCSPRNPRYGYVEKNGDVAIPPRFVAAEDFSEGLAAVRVEQLAESKYGYIDRTGKMVIEPTFDQALSFSEGLAAVETGFKADGHQKIAGKWGFINQNGEFVISARFELVHSFAETLAEVSPEGDRWGYIDHDGRFAISPVYSETNAFSGGLALVWPVDGERGYYIDQRGKRTLIPKLRAQWSFSDGFTVVGSQGSRQYMDRRGRIVAPYEIAPAQK